MTPPAKQLEDRETPVRLLCSHAAPGLMWWRNVARELLDVCDGPAMVIDEHGNVWAASRTFCQAFHVSATDVEGHPLVDGVPGRWTKSFQSRLVQLVGGATAAEGVLDIDIAAEEMRAYRVAFRIAPAPHGSRAFIVTFRPVGDMVAGALDLAAEPDAAIVWEYASVGGDSRGTWRSAFEMPLQYSTFSVEPRDLLAIVHPDDRNQLESVVDSVGDAIGWTMRLRDGQGQWRWHQARGRILERHEDGSPRRATGVAVDVHPLKEAERQLALTQSSVDHARDMILWVTADGSIAYANDAACATMGWTRSDFSRHNIRELLAASGRSLPDTLEAPADSHGAIGRQVATDPGIWDRMWEHLLEAGGGNAELDLVRTDGKRVPVRLRLSRVAHRGGEYAFVYMEDVTEQLAARRRWCENQSALNLAQRVANLGLLQWDRVRGRVTLSNRLGRMVAVSDSNDVQPRLALRCVLREDRQKVLARIREAVSGGHAAPVDCRVVLLDGSIRHVYGALQLETRQGAEPHSLVAVLQDVTERKQADERLQQHQRNLAHSTRIHTMGEMVAGIAHELAQPLCAISNFASATETTMVRELQQNPESPVAAMLPWVQAVSSEAQRSGKIIDRLRSYVRGTEPHRAPHELRELLQYAVDLLAMEARARGVEVRFLASNPSCSVVVDSVQMQQVIVNLVRNAFDAFEGHDHPLVRIVTLMTSDTVRIDIADNGRGVDGDLERIFEPFATSKQEGMGMGLAIARTIVNQHNGRIWATRNQAAGLTFHILLPRNAKVAVP